MGFQDRENKHKGAFPIALKDNGNPFHPDAMGVTKIEYFAGVALQGLLSNITFTSESTPTEMAEHSIAYAEALLRELKKK